MGRTCGEPNKIKKNTHPRLNEMKKNTHPKNITALLRDQTAGPRDLRHGARGDRGPGDRVCVYGRVHRVRGEQARAPGTRPGPFNSISVGVNSVSRAQPHVYPMGRTCR